MPFVRLKLEGKRFGKLTVTTPFQYKKGGWMWNCRCDCGNDTTAYGSKLLQGKKKSCGCGVDGENNYGWKGYREIMGTVWNHVYEHAKVRKLDVAITIQDGWELFVAQERKCALSGVPLYFAKNSKEIDARLQTASLDRIDSSKGYTKDNVQWIHKDLNKMKWSWDQTEFIKWCKLVAEHQTHEKTKAKTN